MTEELKALLGQPSYGEVTSGSARAFYRASRGQVTINGCERKLHLALRAAESSLLALNFNTLWCEALNRVHFGEGCDYFAMLHADCEPRDFWLDELIEELEARDLDVLGVVSPIKDPNGLTSIAIEREDGQQWRPKCRLTMNEVHNLPQTFTAEDVGGPLLLNTGCWVAKFNMDWAKRVGFTINDRIVFSNASGKFEPEVEPEDWNFSRQLNKLGLRLGATTKIGLNHRGSAMFSNAFPWGEMAFDTHYQNESVVAKFRDDGFGFPSEINGWLHESEGRLLASISDGKDVLEIGSYCGKSTVCIARAAKSVVSVDFHDGRTTPNERSTYQEFLSNLERYGVEDKVACVHPDLQHELNQEFDVVFIDGDHDESAVRRDVDTAMRVLRPGGVIAFHDFREVPGDFDGRWDEGVTKTVKSLLADGAVLIEKRGTVAVVQPNFSEVSNG